MKIILIAFIFFSLSITTYAGPKHGEKANPSETIKKEFGGKITSDKVVALDQVIADYDKFQGQPVVFEAKAKKVCKKSGCWMVLKDGKNEVRTLFKDYGFFVPKSILGKKVRVQGKMRRKKVSAATIRHFMKDEGKKLEEIKKVKTSQLQFEFEADAVEII